MRAFPVVFVTFMLCAHALGQYKEDTTPHWMNTAGDHADKDGWNDEHDDWNDQHNDWNDQHDDWNDEHDDWNGQHNDWNEQIYSSGSNLHMMQLSSLMVLAFVAARFAFR